MKFIFCADPILRGQVDPAYSEEAKSAESNGFECSLLNFEALSEGSTERAVNRIGSAGEKTPAIFRGWMMKPATYANLYEALSDKSIELINSSDEYRHCHHLPASFELIEHISPRSVWLKISSPLDFDAIWPAISVFGSSPIIVKDFVKSRKHEWSDAFFIKAADDRDEVRRVVTNFVERQSDDLNEGLVFREFVDFEQIGNHPKSGLPLFREYRLFFLNHSLLETAEYWETGNYTADRPPLDEFADLGSRIQSNFFTMDVAKTKSGKWLVVELGDGQVAGLPERMDIDSFYTKLAAQLKLS